MLLPVKLGHDVLELVEGHRLDSYVRLNHRIQYLIATCTRQQVGLHVPWRVLGKLVHQSVSHGLVRSANCRASAARPPTSLSTASSLTQGVCHPAPVERESAGNVGETPDNRACDTPTPLRTCGGTLPVFPGLGPGAGPALARLENGKLSERLGQQPLTALPRHQAAQAAEPSSKCGR